MTFGWRGMLKIKHVPEQLIDVTITPVLFLLMFTYLFGGAVARLDERVPAVHPARHPRPVGAVHVRLLRRRAEHRHDEGRRRPLPLAADLAPGAARRRGDRRLRALRARRHGRRRCSASRMGYSPGGGIAGVLGGDGARDRLRVRAVVGLHDARPGAALAERGDEHRLHGAVPAALPEQHLRRPEHAARRRSRRSSTSTRSRTS